MRQMLSAVSFTLILTLGASACAPPTAAPAPRSAPAAEPRGQAPTAPEPRGQTAAAKKIVVSIYSDPSGLEHELTNPTPSSGSVPGLAEFCGLLNGSLSYLDSESVSHPWLAEALPTVENGLWQVLPDGRMETTWRLKPGIKWHDGVPLTADDLRFSLDVYRDREIGVVVIPGLALVEAVEVRDAQTAVVKWESPFIDADLIFGSAPTRLPTMWPLPSHLLEQPFKENKAGFLGLPYWNEGFVGSGPFKMQEWSAGSHVVLGANPDYVLGRPKIDQIEVRFIQDRSTLKAAMLAGAVHVPIGRGLNVEDALQLQGNSQGVKVQLGGMLGGVLPIYPQSIDPDPPIVANLQFRRALLMAIDRQELTDALNGGLGPVAHSWVRPDQPEGRAVDGRIVRYPHDPRAAAQIIEGLGYTKGSDGVYQARDGSKLSFGLLTHEQNSFHLPTSLAVQTHWQRFGADVQLEVLPTARARDLRVRALFPAFFLLSKGVLRGPEAYFTRSAIPVAENNYFGGNAGRYGTAELDALVERYARTIAFGERMGVLGDMVHIQTDQATMLPLFFQGAASILGSSRVKNVLAGQVWNSHLWELD